MLIANLIMMAAEAQITYPKGFLKSCNPNTRFTFQFESPYRSALYLTAKQGSTTGIYKNFTFVQAKVCPTTSTYFNSTHEYLLVFKDLSDKSGTKNFVLALQLTNKEYNRRDTTSNIYNITGDSNFPFKLNNDDITKINNKYFSFLQNVPNSRYLLYTPDASTELLRSLVTYYSDTPIVPTATCASSPYGYTYNIQNIDEQTGYKLCWGNSLVVFQNQLRGNYFLWLWFIFTFCFWILSAMNDKETPECEQEDFANNKMTCWTLYSLWYLGHPIYFSKFLRLTHLYTVSSFIFFFVACMTRLQIYQIGRVTILWYGASAFALIQPISFLYGLMITKQQFLMVELFKTKLLQKGKLVKNHPDDIRIDAHIASLEYDLFFWEFFYYTIALSLSVALPIAYIKLAEFASHSTYFIHFGGYDIAACAIGWFLNYFLLEPLCALILGNFIWWQNRGQYFDVELMESFNCIKEY